MKKILLICLIVLFVGEMSPKLAEVKKTPKDRSPEEVMNYVEKAINLILEIGEEKAFAELTESKGKWVAGDWYIYVNNFDGFVVAHLNKKLVGMNLLGVRDVKGNPFYVELQKAAQRKEGQGWVEYWWPKANSKIPARKLGFGKAVPGKRIWVGTGVYGMSDANIQTVLEKHVDQNVR